MPMLDVIAIVSMGSIAFFLVDYLLGTIRHHHRLTNEMRKLEERMKALEDAHG